MRAIAAGLTDVGRERAHNEDRYIVVPELNLYVVADGMGGHQSGEVASRLAANTIASYFRNGDTSKNKRTLADRLRSAVATANAKIYARADDERTYRGMGTTVVAAVFSSIDGMFYVGHAGDSRCYRVRDSKITQLTESDLSYLPRIVITRALGMGPTVEVDLRQDKAHVGDIYLLCSDGLHGLVSDAEITEIIVKHHALNEACEKLIEKANENGGRDNITAVLIRIEDGPEPSRRARTRTRQ